MKDINASYSLTNIPMMLPLPHSYKMNTEFLQELTHCEINV